MTAQQNQDHGAGIAHNHDEHERLIQRVLHALGPAADGGQVATNISFAQRLVAALIELRLVHARSTEQDQPKKEDAPRKNRQDPVS